LSDGPFWLGKKVSLLDLHYSPFMERLAGLKKMWGVEIPQECTRIHEWLEAMKNVKSLKAAGRSAEEHYKGLLHRIQDSEKTTVAV
jgi:glutathione S-transferase